MPDIGMLELILIGIVAFLVLGPERMPELISQIGNAIRHARRWMGEMKHQFHQETEGLRGEVDEVKDAVSGGLSTMPDDVANKPGGEPVADIQAINKKTGK